MNAKTETFYKDNKTLELHKISDGIYINNSGQIIKQPELNGYSRKKSVANNKQYNTSQTTDNKDEIIDKILLLRIIGVFIFTVAYALIFTIVM